MTKTCVLCKKQHIPYDSTRSFHKFPNNLEIQKEWMKITGVSKISRNSTVCSDHFEADSFHQTDGYTTVRRLLSSAVPTISASNCTSDIDNHCTETSTDTSTNISFNKRSTYKEEPDIENSVDSTDALRFFSFVKSCNEQTLTNTIEIYRETSNSSNEIHLDQIWLPKSTDRNEDYSNNKNLEPTEIEAEDSAVDKCLSSGKERKKPKKHQTKDYAITKQFRFKEGFQNHSISREDFASDAAWKKFIKYTIYKNSQVEAARQRSWRRERKVGILKELVKCLKGQKNSAAEYLKIVMDQIPLE